MDFDLAGGRYVVAVSGGVDSMVLLELLRRKPGVDVIVAHYDHGIREDSVEDRKLIQDITKRQGVQFVYDEGNLGPEASEAVARQARYEFLNKVRLASKSVGIVTAHHQDDLAETAVLNLLRGTNRSGLGALNSTDDLKRPLLHVTKSELLQFAQENNISWREDSTNQDTKYLRNYIRHEILPKLSPEDHQKLLDLIMKTKALNEEINQELVSLLHVQPALNTLDRHWFIMLPHAVAMEVMVTWLKRHNVKDIDKKMISKLVNVARTSPPNRVADINKTYILRIGSKELIISLRNR